MRRSVVKNNWRVADDPQGMLDCSRQEGDGLVVDEYEAHSTKSFHTFHTGTILQIMQVRISRIRPIDSSTSHRRPLHGRNAQTVLADLHLEESKYTSRQRVFARVLRPSMHQAASLLWSRARGEKCHHSIWKKFDATFTALHQIRSVSSSVSSMMIPLVEICSCTEDTYPMLKRTPCAPVSG
ncbi:uncharacterized protein BDZ83DRAFT_734013 [Colletotrichum acutatum]|uniref:Uncharacterized protein n=1 Tax=Glomerella acutata TaxID=27357 RepID=A0AAD8UAX3_GLOAC|nr:uncharacterized protein BDZ83DRAFT_734013 [Colletotrichum acutatum]KAK1716746.1 hypothetical protein BDZ83DRAFT_734013 [Colletotrichum acutatum]